MSWTLVIISKTISIMTDLNGRFIDLDKLQRVDADLIGFGVALTEHRVKRVLREDMLDVGDEQFLMLLLVMDSKRQNRFDLAKQFLVGIGNQIINV